MKPRKIGTAPPSPKAGHYITIEEAKAVLAIAGEFSETREPFYLEVEGNLQEVVYLRGLHDYVFHVSYEVPDTIGFDECGDEITCDYPEEVWQHASADFPVVYAESDNYLVSWDALREHYQLHDRPFTPNWWRSEVKRLDRWKEEGKLSDWVCGYLRPLIISAYLSRLRLNRDIDRKGSVLPTGVSIRPEKKRKRQKLAA